MVSYMAHGLFARAISQSGCLYGLPQETRSERAEKTKSLARAMECPLGNDNEALSCLRDKPAQELHDKAFLNKYISLIPITIDDVFDGFLTQSITDRYT